MKIKYGCTRVVLLIGKYAIKFPSFETGYIGFLKGILNSLEECSITKWNPAVSVSKTLYCNCTGLFLIAERAREVKNIDLYKVELERLCTLSPDESDFYMDDARPDNFGYIDGRLVKVDYARYKRI
jgi:hypothetical protein